MFLVFVLFAVDRWHENNWLSGLKGRRRSAAGRQMLAKATAIGRSVEICSGPKDKTCRGPKTFFRVSINCQTNPFGRFNRFSTARRKTDHYYCLYLYRNYLHSYTATLHFQLYWWSLRLFWSKVPFPHKNLLWVKIEIYHKRLFHADDLSFVS